MSSLASVWSASTRTRNSKMWVLSRSIKWAYQFSPTTSSQAKGLRKKSSLWICLKTLDWAEKTPLRGLFQGDMSTLTILRTRCSWVWVLKSSWMPFSMKASKPQKWKGDMNCCLSSLSTWNEWVKYWFIYDFTFRDFNQRFVSFYS